MSVSAVTSSYYDHKNEAKNVLQFQKIIFDDPNDAVTLYSFLCKDDLYEITFKILSVFTLYTGFSHLKKKKLTSTVSQVNFLYLAKLVDQHEQVIQIIQRKQI